MFARGPFQWWYRWQHLEQPVGQPAWRRAAVRYLARCLLACAVISSARSASALEEPDAPLCDPEVLASGSQIECERPPPAPEPPAGAAEAPMCDETGASVAARAVIPEVDGGRLDVLPCELVLALFGGKKLDTPRSLARWAHQKPPAEPVQLTLARADAALVSPLPMPERAASCVLLEPSASGLAASPGHLRPPYRPPLS